MKVVSCTIHEPKIGTWVASVKSLDEPAGQFEAAGLSWNGTIKETQFDGVHHRSMIVGGSGTLGQEIRSLQLMNAKLADVVSRIASVINQPVAEIEQMFSVSSYYRGKGKAGEAIQKACETYDVIWWIDRQGELHIRKERQSTAEATGQEETADSVSALLVNPKNVELGGTYKGQTIQQVLWNFSSSRSEARLYFRQTEEKDELDYTKQHVAEVRRQNGNRIDLIVNGRFNLKDVPFYAGVADAYVTLERGDLVNVFFLGHDPRKPQAHSVRQRTAGTGENVARVGDSVDCGILAIVWEPGTPPAIVEFLHFPNTVEGNAALAALKTAAANAGNIVFDTPVVGVISSGTGRLKL